MSKAVYSRSSIARPLEPQYKTNLAVLVLMPIIGFAGFVWAGQNGMSGLGQIFSALSYALVGFLSWAAAREFDPDRNAGAFLAMALAVAAAFFIGETAVWTMAFALMAIRVVNRSVGLPVKFGDILIVAALAALAVFRDGYAQIGFVAATAFALDAFLDRKRTLNLLGALVTLSFTAWELIELQGDFEALLLSAVAVMDPMKLYVALGVLALGVLHALLLGRVRSTGDATGEPLSGFRVRGGILVFCLTGLAVLPAGEAAALHALPLYAIIIGVVIGRFIPFGQIR